MAHLVDAQGRVVIPQIECAESLLARGLGLMGRKSLEEETGFWIEPCKGVHTLGMRFALDVVYLKSDGEVLHLLEGVPPWRLCPFVWKARAVLELPAGAVSRHGIRLGSHYHLKPSSQ